MGFILGCCGNSSPETELFVLRLKRRWARATGKRRSDSHTRSRAWREILAPSRCTQRRANSSPCWAEGRLLRRLIDSLQFWKSTLAQLFTDLEHALPVDHQKAVHAEPDWEQVRAVCARLESLLNQSDGDAADVMNENADLIRAAFPNHYGRINDAIQGFDCQTALTLLHDAQQSSAAKLASL